MKLIVGLGNKGEKYKDTPHNLGFMVVERLSQLYKTPFKKKLPTAFLAEFRLNREKIILAKPLTFMNLSGRAVSEIMKRKRISVKDILVVCDDFNLTFGKLRIRPYGSAGGHHGLRSIIENLETENFCRLRIGIGKPDITDISDYVLRRFDKRELETVASMLERAVEAILVFVREGIEKAMNKFN